MDPITVLIVDDEAPARRRMREVLGDCAQAYPIEIVGEAESGRQGLALAQSLGADLLFVDIRMADMDGLELARHLLKLPTPPAVIFTTAYEQHAVDAHRHVDEVPGAHARAGEVLGLAVDRVDVAAALRHRPVDANA